MAFTEEDVKRADALGKEAKRKRLFNEQIKANVKPKGLSQESVDSALAFTNMPEKAPEDTSVKPYVDVEAPINTKTFGPGGGLAPLETSTGAIMAKQHLDTLREGGVVGALEQMGRNIGESVKGFGRGLAKVAFGQNAAQPEIALVDSASPGGTTQTPSIVPKIPPLAAAGMGGTSPAPTSSSAPAVAGQPAQRTGPTGNIYKDWGPEARPGATPSPQTGFERGLAAQNATEARLAGGQPTRITGGAAVLEEGGVEGLPTEGMGRPEFSSRVPVGETTKPLLGNGKIFAIDREGNVATNSAAIRRTAEAEGVKTVGLEGIGTGIGEQKRGEISPAGRDFIRSIGGTPYVPRATEAEKAYLADMRTRLGSGIGEGGSNQQRAANLREKQAREDLPARRAHELALVRERGLAAAEAAGSRRPEGTPFKTETVGVYDEKGKKIGEKVVTTDERTGEVKEQAQEVDTTGRKAIEAEIAKQQQEIASGDNRTGLFNYKSRQERIKELQGQLAEMDKAEGAKKETPAAQPAEQAPRRKLNYDEFASQFRKKRGREPGMQDVNLAISEGVLGR